MNYLANCSMLFTELPLLERPAAARHSRRIVLRPTARVG